MVSRTKKTVLVYTMLIMSTIVTECQGHTAHGFVSPGGTVSQTAQGFTTTKTFSSTGTNTWTPVNNFNSHPAAKGFYPSSGWNGYNQYPVNTQYWTGHTTQYMPHQQYPYNQYAYNNLQHPAQYGQYPLQHGYAHHQTGHNNYYGNYPNFDAGYWAGHGYHPAPVNPMYVPHNAAYMPHHAAYMPHHAAYMPHPVYHHPQLMHHNPVFYQGHWVTQPMYPYPPANFNRGFLGGTGGELAKGMLGALVVGTIAGKVARGK